MVTVFPPVEQAMEYAQKGGRREIYMRVYFSKDSRGVILSCGAFAYPVHADADTRLYVFDKAYDLPLRMPIDRVLEDVVAAAQKWWAARGRLLSGSR